MSNMGETVSNLAAPAEVTHVSFEDAQKITDAERDKSLGLEAPVWPSPSLENVPSGWRSDEGFLYRDIDCVPPRKRKETLPDHEREIPVQMREHMLRFPSAPLHGVQRLHQYHAIERESQNLHSLRVLTSTEPASRIERIYLFHNGLNELTKNRLFYEFAARLIAHDPAAACVLRPFPGHLTRAPYASFSETPLQRYLWDGSHLFRQFLRHMTETQWLLSTIVKRSCYRCASGALLLAEHGTVKGSRLNPERLAQEMHAAWMGLHDASEEALKLVPSGEVRPRLSASAPSADVFRCSIEALRRVLGLHNWDDRTGDLRQSDNETHSLEPSLHVIGYSIGGFVAQSVFMSWPFLVDSCATLLSGGALRELSPTAFATPEEWQTVLHSLRYELDDGMMAGRYGMPSTSPGRDAAKRLAGMQRQLFLYFQRTFYEVFEQEYRGSFQSRLAAFRRRMLFIVGGGDEVVKPGSVQDSAPSGGINMLEIGGLSHFLGSRPQGEEEKGQRAFWMPELARVIGSFAAEAATEHAKERNAHWLDAGMEVPEMTTAERKHRGLRRLGEQERLDVGEHGELPSGLFDAYLNDLIERQVNGPKGLLLVLRNEIPTMLLSEKAVQRRARALPHDDAGIIEYCQGVRVRREALKDMPGTRLILPWNAYPLFMHMDPPHGFPSQAETAVGQLLDEESLQRSWQACEQTLNGLQKKAAGSVLVYDGREPMRVRQGHNRAKQTIEDIARRAAGNGANGEMFVHSLPDCWVWVSRSFLGVGPQSDVRSLVDAFIAEVFNRYGGAESDLATPLRGEELRVVAVSRARYNPRFRGSVVVEPKTLREMLQHAAFCLAGSYRLSEFDLRAGSPRRKRAGGASKALAAV